MTEPPVFSPEETREWQGSLLDLLHLVLVALVAKALHDVVGLPELMSHLLVLAVAAWKFWLRVLR